MLIYLRTIVLSILLIYSFTFCSSNYNDEELVYEYLEICFEDYYLNYDVHLTQELELFERQLILEGHLQDTTGMGYNQLLSQLSKEIYFQPPLKFDEFNNVLLYKVPGDLKECASSVFGLDSAIIKETSYFKAQERIRGELKNNEQIDAGDLFNFNRKYIPAELMRSPFVKQSIQLMLYKWYFKSKYDREIPIQEDSNNPVKDSIL